MLWGVIWSYYINMPKRSKTNNKKNLTCGEKDHPHGIVLRKRPSHTGQENPRTPAPIHSGPSPYELGRTQTMLWTWGQTRGFFYHCTTNRKIRPRRGSNPGRQAGGATEPASQSGLAAVRTWKPIWMQHFYPFIFFLYTPSDL